jgi:hypothetical protein
VAELGCLAGEHRDRHASALRQRHESVHVRYRLEHCHDRFRNDRRCLVRPRLQQVRRAEHEHAAGRVDGLRGRQRRARLPRADLAEQNRGALWTRQQLHQRASGVRLRRVQVPSHGRERLARVAKRVVQHRALLAHDAHETRAVAIEELAQAFTVQRAVLARLQVEHGGDQLRLLHLHDRGHVAVLVPLLFDGAILAVEHALHEQVGAVARDAPAVEQPGCDASGDVRGPRGRGQRVAAERQVLHRQVGKHVRDVRGRRAGPEALCPRQCFAQQAHCVEGL